MGRRTERGGAKVTSYVAIYCLAASAPGRSTAEAEPEDTDEREWAPPPSGFEAHSADAWLTREATPLGDVVDVRRRGAVVALTALPRRSHAAGAYGTDGSAAGTREIALYCADEVTAKRMHEQLVGMTRGSAGTASGANAGVAASDER